MKRAFLTFVLCLSSPALAQSVTGVSLLDDKTSTYQMNIDGKPYFAYPRDFALQLVNDRERLRKELVAAEEDKKKYRSVVDSYEQLRKDYVALTEKFKTLADDSLKLGERYSEAAGKLVALNEEYRKLVSDYDALARKYRAIALTSSPRQAIDLGAGFVRAGDSNHIVGMAGLGYQVFGLGVRGWVFGGQSTYGAMLGVSF